MTRETVECVVVSSYGRRFDLRLADGNLRTARLRGRRLRPVCGDRVLAEALPREEDFLITEVLPRSNELARPDARGRKEVLAANVSMLAVVTAPTPRPDWFIVDRYVAAAELMRAKALIVCNKIDLGTDDAVDAALRDYAGVDYRVVRTSVVLRDGISALRAALGGHTTVFAGQSGTGKSSLLNCLDPDIELPTGNISRKSGEGRHTTVRSAMFELVPGSFVIDSPGVRDFAPSIDEPDRVESGFREIAAASVACRYADCRHLAEPDCAVRAAVKAGRISARRLESYKRLLRLTKELSTRY
ncbi:MAG: ribosome small subunit-dependent GTPase A [Woeseiaceae bacterium]|nr:ribosome small subunit-dependent GTPase A [Woeseiaceae bacterium]